MVVHHKKKRKIMNKPGLRLTTQDWFC